ncbi:MAG: flagellar motor protein MotB [Clostridiales bacterium]|nr:flagellar motor protein MotB [Clostridiales bacterium]
MSKKVRKKRKVNKDGWLVTYADMVTLILVFFILLHSISTIDQEKYRLLVKAFTRDPETLERIRLEETEIEEGNLDPLEGGFEDEFVDDIADIMDFFDLYLYLKNYVAERNLEHAVQVEKGENIVYVRFMSSLFFEPDKASLLEGGKDILDHVGGALARVEGLSKFVRIDGHTAEADRAIEVVSDRDLSTERANAVLKYLEGQYIKDPAKLIAVGYGMHRPVAPNDSEENRAKNRRVEIIVGERDILQEELDKIYSLSGEYIN